MVENNVTSTTRVVAHQLVSNVVQLSLSAMLHSTQHSTQHIVTHPPVAGFGAAAGSDGPTSWLAPALDLPRRAG